VIKYFVLFLLCLSSCTLFQNYGSSDLDSGYEIAFAETLDIKVKIDDPDIEYGDYWQSPAETLALGTGDCEDMALLLEYKLKLLNLPVTFVVGRVRADAMGNHSWCEVRDRKGKTVAMDPYYGWWFYDPKPPHYIAYTETNMPLAVQIKMMLYQLRLECGK
jgi:hypothetical protein